MQGLYTKWLGVRDDCIRLVRGTKTTSMCSGSGSRGIRMSKSESSEMDRT
jgi:hypothetical protein